jgi:N-acetylglutamate synthase-like GNAT family acetyltransferase
VSDLAVRPYEPSQKEAVATLITSIQRGEFGIPITLADQPDLQDIPGFYRKGRGNFWVAMRDGAVVGTIALIDIGEGQGALRKMFVHPDHRGGKPGAATVLLDTLLNWAKGKGLEEILLGTTDKFLAAHRFYAKNGFDEIPAATLPDRFPRMAVDSKFYRRRL